MFITKMTAVPPDGAAWHGRHARAAAARSDGAGADGHGQDGRQPVTRFGAVFVPLGERPGYWTPKTAGANFEFTPILKPLEPFRDQLRWSPSSAIRWTVMRRQCRAWLSGVVPFRTSPRTCGRASRSIRSSPTRSARTRRCRRSSSPPRTSPAGSAGANGVQLRLHEHDLVEDADDAAADGDQSARRVRADVRAARAPRAAPGAHAGEPQHSRLGRAKTRATCRRAGHARRGRLNDYLDNVREIEQRIQKAEKQTRPPT